MINTNPVNIYIPSVKLEPYLPPYQKIALMLEMLGIPVEILLEERIRHSPHELAYIVGPYNFFVPQYNGLKGIKNIFCLSDNSRIVIANEAKFDPGSQLVDLAVKLLFLRGGIDISREAIAQCLESGPNPLQGLTNWAKEQKINPQMYTYGYKSKSGLQEQVPELIEGVLGIKVSEINDRIVNKENMEAKARNEAQIGSEKAEELGVQIKYNET